jgi:hypothetical protein
MPVHTAATCEKTFMSASTADLKFLHLTPQVHDQELQIESGTGIDNLPVPFGFRSSIKRMPR